MGAVRNKNVTKMETTYVKQQEGASLAMLRKRKILYRRLSVFFVISFIVSFLMVSSIFSQSSKLKTEMAQKHQLNKQLASLENQQSVLKGDIVKLNNNDYIAKYARSEYFLSNKGEIIFNIPNEKQEN